MHGGLEWDLVKLTINRRERKRPSPILIICSYKFVGDIFLSPLMCWINANSGFNGQRDFNERYFSNGRNRLS
jgi:hypothetical protein